MRSGCRIAQSCQLHVTGLLVTVGESHPVARIGIALEIAKEIGAHCYRDTVHLPRVAGIERQQSVGALTVAIEQGQSVRIGDRGIEMEDAAGAQTVMLFDRSALAVSLGLIRLRVRSARGVLVAVTLSQSCSKRRRMSPDTCTASGLACAGPAKTSGASSTAAQDRSRLLFIVVLSKVDVQCPASATCADGR